MLRLAPFAALILLLTICVPEAHALEADQLLRNTSKSNSTSEVALSAAHSALRNSDYAGALAGLTKQLELSPKDARLWCLVAYCHDQLGDSPRTIAASQIAAVLRKRNEDGEPALYRSLERIQGPFRIRLEQSKRVVDQSKDSDADLVRKSLGALNVDLVKSPVEIAPIVEAVPIVETTPFVVSVPTVDTKANEVVPTVEATPVVETTPFVASVLPIETPADEVAPADAGLVLVLLESSAVSVLGDDTAATKAVEDVKADAAADAKDVVSQEAVRKGVAEYLTETIKDEVLQGIVDRLWNANDGKDINRLGEGKEEKAKAEGLAREISKGISLTLDPAPSLSWTVKGFSPINELPRFMDNAYFNRFGKDTPQEVKDALKKSLRIIPPPAPAEAVINASSTAYAGDAVSFDGSKSTAEGSKIGKYEWDFDYDGSTFNVDAEGPTGSHTYDTAKVWTVALRITVDGAPHLKTAQVTVENKPSTVVVAVPCQSQPCCAECAESPKPVCVAVSCVCCCRCINVRCKPTRACCDSLLRCGPRRGFRKLLRCFCQ